jgi:hypothetical protein
LGHRNHERRWIKIGAHFTDQTVIIKHVDVIVLDFDLLIIWEQASRQTVYRIQGDETDRPAHTFGTTEQFPCAFDLECLRDLPDRERLEEAGQAVG